MQFVDCPLEHTFTPGLYSRQITMPTGCLIVSEVHKFEHQYVVLDGVVEVWTEETGWVLYKAPFSGITKAGTRRVLKIHLTTIWQTFHPTNCTTVEAVHDEIIENRENTLIQGKFQNNIFVPKGKMISNNSINNQ